MKTVVISLLLMLSFNTMADGECDKYKTQYDQTYCFVKLFMESDKELNTVYKELTGKISKSAKPSLKETQRNWMQYRDSTCQSQPGTILVDCNYKVNRERTDYLRDRLRECETGTCRDDMIGNKSWN